MVGGGSVVPPTTASAQQERRAAATRTDHVADQGLMGDELSLCGIHQGVDFAHSTQMGLDRVA